MRSLDRVPSSTVLPAMPHPATCRHLQAENVDAAAHEDLPSPVNTCGEHSLLFESNVATYLRDESSEVVHEVYMSHHTFIPDALHATQLLKGLHNPINVVFRRDVINTQGTESPVNNNILLVREGTAWDVANDVEDAGLKRSE